MNKYVTYFKVELEVTPEEENWLLAQGNLSPDDFADAEGSVPEDVTFPHWFNEDCEGCLFQCYKARDGHVVIDSDGEDNPEDASVFLSAFLAEFRPTQGIPFNVVHTDGGRRSIIALAFITAKSITWWDQNEWVNAQRLKLAQELGEAPPSD